MFTHSAPARCGWGPDLASAHSLRSLGVLVWAEAGSLLRVLLAQELIQHEVWKHSLSGLLGFWVGVNDKVLASGCH